MTKTMSKLKPSKELVDKPKLTPIRVVQGAVGLTKHAVGKDRATKEEAERRWAICSSCEHFEMGICVGGGCGCHLSAKVRLDSYRCKLGKWDKDGDDG